MRRRVLQVVFKWARVALKSALALSLVLVALIGFAHTKTGRPLRPLLGLGARVGGCPLGYDQTQTPEQRELARRSFAATHAGSQSAPERPALGFDLDVTTQADVESWAKTNHVSCIPHKSGADLACEHVSSDLLPAHFNHVRVDDLWLNFGEKSQLISIVAIRRDPSAVAVSTAFEQITDEVTREAGQATASNGHASATQLSSGLLHQTSAEYRFHNYYALARATNMGDAFVLTEEYRSLPD